MSRFAALYKYIFKGSDEATVEIMPSEVESQDRAALAGPAAASKRTVKKDEICQFVSGRYISGPEAAWRILTFPIHYRTHAVYRLPIHLEDEQQVFFAAADQEHVNMDRAKKTMLTMFFALYAANPGLPKLFDQDLPKHYVWDKKQLEWRPARVVGRIRFVQPSSGELFYF